MKITVTFDYGGRKLRRTLKTPDKLSTIDPQREALFIFDNFEVYKGFSDGEIDIDGDFCISAAIDKQTNFAGIGLPFRRLVGYTYTEAKK